MVSIIEYIVLIGIPVELYSNQTNVLPRQMSKKSFMITKAIELIIFPVFTFSFTGQIGNPNNTTCLASNKNLVHGSSLSVTLH